MSKLPRPLIVGLGGVPAALMIVTEHPWLGVATFAAVLAGVLLDSRARELPSDTARPDQPREVGTLSLSGPIHDDDPGPRPRGDGLIHYPPRRLL